MAGDPLGGLIDKAVGGDKDGVKKFSNISKEQKAFLNNQLLPFFQNILSDIPGFLKGFPLFDYDSAPATGLQNKALDAASNIDPAGQPLTDPLQIAGRDTILDILARNTPGSPEFEEFYNTNVRNPLYEEAFGGRSDSIINNLKRTGAAGDSLFGSQSRDRETQLGSDVFSSLAQTRGNLALGSRQADTQNALGALGLANNFTEGTNADQQLNRILQLFGIGEGERQINKEYIDNAYSEFLRQVGERDNLLSLFSNTALTQTNQPIKVPTTLDNISQIVGIAGSLYGGGGGGGGAGGGGSTSSGLYGGGN